MHLQLYYEPSSFNYEPSFVVIIAIIIIVKITPPSYKECIQTQVGCCVKNEVIVVHSIIAVGVFVVVLNRINPLPSYLCCLCCCHLSTWVSS